MCPKGKTPIRGSARPQKIGQATTGQQRTPSQANLAQRRAEEAETQNQRTSAIHSS